MARSVGKLPAAAFAFAVVLASCGLVSAATTANFGLLIPKSGLSCMRSAEYWHAALVAVDYVHAQPWWPKDVALNMTVMNATTSYESWSNAQNYVNTFTAAGSAPIGLVGPVLSDGMLYTRYVASQANMPVIGFATTSYALTDLDGASAGSFFRTCQNDVTTAQAIFKAMYKLGMQLFNVLYVHDSFGRAFFENMQALAAVTANMTLMDDAYFDSGNKHSIEAALEKLKESESRITVIVAAADDAQLVMKMAKEMGMTGKGWQYIGAGWVQSHVWLDNSDDKDQEDVKEAMQGVIGVRPDRDQTPSFQNGTLMTFKYTPGVTKAGDHMLCPGLLAADIRAGVPTNPYVTMAFDAVFALASAYASSYTLCGPHCATGAGVKAMLANSTVEWSPLTSKMIFLSSGDKFNVTLNLVNIQGDKVVNVGTWMAEYPNKTDPTVHDYLTAGSWGPLGSIIYSGGGTAVPADRVAEVDHMGVWLYFLVLLGVLISVLIGSAMHRNHMYNFPESGATIIVGMLIGLFLVTVASPKLVRHAKFDPELFSLALLPIIIFESGYSLNLNAFFSQLGSVLMFALAGTVTATLICGLILFEFGKSGAVPALSFEECMAFASLVSATDPVATLSVFSALNVQPHLYAIVYGEAVLNDAVAIVLYRTFTKFLTVEATSGLWVLAVLTFFGILIGSTIIGLIFGLLSTLCWKYWDLGQKESNGIAETGVLLLFAYGSYAFSEACGLSGIVGSLFCGIFMNHYNTRVLSANGKNLAYHGFKLLAYLSETSVFVQVGLNVIAFAGDFRIGLVILMIVVCIFARACQVFTYANVLNCFRSKPIPTNHIIQIWHAGLRGAIAYALSTSFPSQNQGLIINCTSCIVVFTIFVMGGTTTTSLKMLKIECAATAHLTDVTAKSMNQEAVKESKTKQWLVNKDKTIIKPFLYRDSVQLDEEAETQQTPAEEKATNV